MTGTFLNIDCNVGCFVAVLINVAYDQFCSRVLRRETEYCGIVVVLK